MRAFFEVIDELFVFIEESLFGVLRGVWKGGEQEPVVPSQPRLPLPPQSPSLLPGPTSKGGVFVLSGGAKLRRDPAVVFDNVLTVLPYGSAVAVEKYGGRWAYVRWEAVAGWVLKDELTVNQHDIFPVLQIGSVYDYTHPDTERIRRYIGDIFGVESASLPLFAEEWVWYQLMLDGRNQEAWPATRPRTAGRWQHILRGMSHVYMSIDPKIGSVMEWQQGEEGCLAVVRAVSASKAVTFDGVGIEGSGVYSYITLEASAWRELRPVFIQFR